MNPQMQFGSGSPLLGSGATSAINEAMARRGIDVSAMAQSGSTTAQPMPTAPQGSSMPPTGDMGMPPIPAGQPAMPGQPLPQGASDSEIILKALSSRLSSDSKIKEAQSIPPKPEPTPSPVQPF